MVDVYEPGSLAVAQREDRRRWIGLAVLLTAVFVSVLDNFIVIVAIPSIRSDLGATFSQVEFVVAGYTLTFALGLITSGRMGDRFGRRRMFLIGFAAFTVASGLCGLAPTAFSLIVSRLLQGIAGAVLTPQVLALIKVTFVSPRDRATAFAWMGVAIGMGGILGQVLGGIVVSADILGLHWRPVFLLNLPVGICALLVGPVVLDESRAAGGQRLDLVGAALSSLGLGMLLFPLIEGREAGWPAWSLIMLVSSFAVFALFMAQQHRKTIDGTSPLLDTSLFRDRAFPVGLLLMLLFFGTISPYILTFSYLTQIGLGLSPVKSALYFSPMAITFVITNLMVGRFAGTDARRTLFAGAVLAAGGTALGYVACALIPVSTFTPAYIIPGLAVLGVGQGLFMTPVVNAVLTEISEAHTGAASGVLNTMQRVGNALGIAILEIPFFSVLDHAQHSGVSPAEAYTSAFASVAAWLTVALVAVVLLLRFLPAAQRS
ncbi:MFS transporter [Bradyrhizobium genosp. P]|uniref:MFS transporter n=1 Tax=Bradyrhizobium genosp. P TaxID=83641 RepID=UPI003CFAD85F